MWIHQTGDLYECSHCGAIEHVKSKNQPCKHCGNENSIEKNSIKRLIDADELINRLETQKEKFSYFYGGNDQFVICIDKIIIPLVNEMPIVDGVEND